MLTSKRLVYQTAHTVEAKHCGCIALLQHPRPPAVNLSGRPPASLAAASRRRRTPFDVSPSTSAMAPSPYSCRVLARRLSAAACRSKRTVPVSYVHAEAPRARRKKSHSPATRTLRHSIGARAFMARIAVARAQRFTDAFVALAMPIQLVSHALYPLRGLILGVAHLMTPRTVSGVCLPRKLVYGRSGQYDLPPTSSPPPS